MTLPIALDDLVDGLNARGTTRSMKVSMRFESATFEGPATAQDWGNLTLTLTVTRLDRAATERWQFDLPLDPGTLNEDWLPNAFVLTVWANVMEWWSVKGHEPHTAQSGRRLDVRP